MHRDRRQARTHVRAHGRPDLGFVTGPQSVTEALSEPYHQFVSASGRGQVVDAHLDHRVAGRLDRQVHQPGERAAGRAHLVADHDLAVHHMQDRLDRQRRTEQCGSGTDATTAPQVLQGVHVEQRGGTGDRRPSRRDGPGQGPVAGRGQHPEAEPQAGGPGVHHRPPTGGRVGDNGDRAAPGGGRHAGTISPPGWPPAERRLRGPARRYNPCASTTWNGLPCMQWLITLSTTWPVIRTRAPGFTMAGSPPVSSYVWPASLRIRQPGSTPACTCPVRTMAVPAGLDGWTEPDGTDETGELAPPDARAEPG